jgi:hypothetical protein
MKLMQMKQRSLTAFEVRLLYSEIYEVVLFDAISRSYKNLIKPRLSLDDRMSIA